MATANLESVQGRAAEGGEGPYERQMKGSATLRSSSQKNKNRAEGQQSSLQKAFLEEACLDEK